MKTPAQAAAKYVTNGSAPAATLLWSTNFNANMTAIFDAAARAVGTWQANVSTTLAANNFTKGLARAKNNTGPIAVKVTNVGAPALAAGVRAAGAPGGNYSDFAAQWLPAVAGEVATLNQTSPRGTRAQNRARQAAYDAWVDQQAGNFRQS